HPTSTLFPYTTLFRSVDALCHVGWDGELYNGRPFADSLSAAGSTWCPIDPLFDGILTRGVLLDVAAGRREGYVTVGNPVTPRELDETAARFGVRVEPRSEEHTSE